MLSEPPTAGPAPYDPENCHACPSWHDRAGRCRLAARQRTCGSNELEVRARAAAGRRVAYDLFEDPAPARADEVAAFLGWRGS
jgi:hypothetical protein